MYTACVEVWVAVMIIDVLLLVISYKCEFYTSIPLAGLFAVQVSLYASTVMTSLDLPNEDLTRGHMGGTSQSLCLYNC